MPGSIGKNAVFYQGGYDLTSYFREFDAADAGGDADTTPFGPTNDETSMPDGTRKGDATLGGFYVQVPVTEPIDATLRAAFQVDTPAAFGPLGDAIGLPLLLWIAQTKQYSVKHPLKGVITTALKSVADGPKRTGQSLHAKATRSSPYTGATYDAGTAGELASGPWIAQIHATAVTSNLTVLVETSADGSTAWVTLTTFTAITSAAVVGSERKSGTAVVHRYRRIRVTAGAGTFAVGLATG